MPYWLRTRDALNLFRQTRIWQPADGALEAEMSAALLAFARHAAPASPEIGRWPAFIPDEARVAWLGKRSQVAEWPHLADFALFAEPAVQASEPGGKLRD